MEWINHIKLLDKCVCTHQRSVCLQYAHQGYEALDDESSLY